MVVFELLQKSLMISLFVAVMMLVVEYVNVRSGGSFTRLLRGSRLRQYVLAALLGAAPGCLGAFVLVTLHIQRSITLGALVAGMIATSGDEIFVMLATVPGTAVLMTAGLVVLGVVSAWGTDTIVGAFAHVDHEECCHFVEEHTASCVCSPEEGVLSLWRPPRWERAVAALGLAGFVASLSAGLIGPEGWDWERIAFVTVGGLGLAIVVLASEEFFKEHLWGHVVRKHVPRLFLWTLGALAVIAVVDQLFDARSFVAENRWAVLLIAAAVGLIPESGPHLIFVTLYADGALPLSVLVASSAVQDGHGMLPLLAHSRRDFVVVKGINFVVGLAAGAALMAFGH
jgi:hypothetical protein